MGTQFWWIFDILIIVVIVLVLASNAKRGLQKNLILSIGYLISTVAASVLAGVAAEPLYESVARDSNVSAIETANTKVDFVEVFSNAIDEQQYGFVCDGKDIAKILSSENNEMFDKELYQYSLHRNNELSIGSEFAFEEVIRKAFVDAYGNEIGERLPNYVRMNFLKAASENSNIMRAVISDIYNPSVNPKTAAEHIEDQFSRQPTIEVLQIFVYLILFSILMVFSALMSAGLQNRIFLNVSKATDHSVGLLLGIMETAAVVILVTFGIRLLVMLGGGDILCFNDQTIEESKLFGFFYDHINIML